MRKSRFSEEQIIFVLRQAEAGVPVAELIRKYVSTPAENCTFVAVENCTLDFGVTGP